MNKVILTINLGIFKFLLICFLFINTNLFSQSVVYEILIDKYSTDETIYPFIREGIKIQIWRSQDIIRLNDSYDLTLVISEYNFESDKFIPIKAFYVTEWINNSFKDGNQWFFLREDTFGEFSFKYNPKTKKGTFADKYSNYNQEFTFLSGETTIKNKVSSIRKKFFDEKIKNDKEIGIKLNEIINKKNIKSILNYRNTINNDVFSDELRNKYQKILVNVKKSYNDSILGLFSSALENKNKELIISHMENLVEYQNKNELYNRILEKFDLNRTLSITNTERFKNYFISFSVNTFPYFSIHNENATINFEIIDGKIKSSTGHTLDYPFSDDEKIILDPFIFFKKSPKLESFTIKKNVKLITLNKTYIHHKKDSQTLFVDKQTLNQEEKTTFRGGKWKPKLIFSKERFSNSEPIKTRSIKSLRNQIKLNLNETFGFLVKGQPGNLKVYAVEDMKTYFNNSISENTPEGFFSNDKKIVNVYTEWVYELYINDKKINETVKTKFNKSPFSYITKPIYFNKPFYTVDVFEVF